MRRSHRRGWGLGEARPFRRKEAGFGAHPPVRVRGGASRTRPTVFLSRAASRLYVSAIRKYSLYVGSIRMSKEESTGKRKLTLSVDEEVVKKAKAIGLNISEITESVLRGFAFAPDQAARGSLHTKYKELFATMQPLLRDYDTSVEIAGWDDAEPGDYPSTVFEVYLRADGTLRKWNFHEWDDKGEGVWTGDEISEDIDISEIPLHAFLKPKDVLARLITAIAKAKEDREEQINDIEMAKRLIAAIDASIGRTSGKDSQTKEKGA